MIDAKQLRIGNWVTYHGETDMPCQLDAQDILNISTNYMHNAEIHSPIPLTPEVLEACEGVKRTPNADWFDWVVCGLNINYNADDDVYFIYEYPNIVFNSLHQLQNLVALTGQELEYKPKV